MANHFSAEAHIKARLETEVGELKRVYTMAESNQNTAPWTFTPVAFLAWAGDRPGAAQAPSRMIHPGGKRIRLIEQHWLVMLAVRNDADTLRNAAARAAAGELYSQILSALDGFDPPEDDLGPLTWTQAELGPRYTPGAVLLPAQFVTLKRTQGATKQWQV